MSVLSFVPSRGVCQIIICEGAGLRKSIRLGWQVTVYISFVGYFSGSTTSCILMTYDADDRKKKGKGPGHPDDCGAEYMVSSLNVRRGCSSLSIKSPNYNYCSV